MSLCGTIDNHASRHWIYAEIVEIREYSEQSVTAVDVQHLTGDEARTGKISAGRRDLVHVAHPPHRDFLNPVAVAVAEMRVLGQTQSR
jgi:hypothetical protein